MRQKLQTLLFALVAMMVPIGAWALGYTVKLPSGIGVTTLYLPFDVQLDANTKAYVVTDVTINEDGSVQLVEEELTDGNIPASTAVIIRNEMKATTTTLNVISGLEPFITEEANLLKGVLVPTAMDVSPGTGNFVLSWDVSADSEWPNLTDWQAHPDNNGSWTYTLGANKAYLDLSGKLEPSKIAELEAFPHLQHTHGGCAICGQVTGVEAAWGASADALTSYGTLDDAIAAAREENSTVGYIQLQEDVENVNNINGGTFTLDLNGHTIGASDESHALEILGADTHVTLKGETEGSMVFENGEGSYAVYVAEGASVAIESGTYKGCYAIHNGSGCSVTIAGGEFEYTGGNAIDNYENLVVKGGTFTHDGESEGDESFPTIFYYSGSIDLSNYPTDEIYSIDVMNYSEEDITTGVETILLPEGYCFFDYEGILVTVLVDGCTYYIGEAPAQYAITFIASDGEGEMEDVIVYEGDYTLPECTFGAPDGMMFDGWQVGDDEENLYQPCDVITITADTEVTAVWGDIKIVINMYDSASDGWHGAYIEVLENGESIGTATLEDGDDGRATFDYDSNCTYSFIWHYGPDDFYPDEISFEISIGEGQLFTSEKGDCEEYADEQQIYPVPTSDELSIADDGSIEECYYTKTIVGTLTYTRTLPNEEWNSLYVPFEIEVTDELLEDYEVAYANNLHAYDRDDNGAIDDLEMEIIKIKQGTLHANHPYFIRAKSVAAKEMELVMEDVTLYNTVENSMTCQSFYTQFTLTGTYSRMEAEDFTGIDGTHYAISTEGGWWQTEGLNPFRVYLTIVDRGESPVKIDEAAFSRVRIRAAGESTTSIDEEQLTIDNKEAIYDLMGRRVMTPQKDAIYIVNGKKVVW